jgi:hypothetical protein
VYRDNPNINFNQKKQTQFTQTSKTRDETKTPPKEREVNSETTNSRYCGNSG